MFSRADSAMRERLEEIWRLCFGDPQAYVDLFFERRFRPEDTMVWLEGGRPAAMLFALPMQLIAEGKSYPARYFYAVATHPDFQGRGLSTRLMEESHRLLAGEGAAAAVLTPASPALFDFYQKRGFAAQFFAETVSLGRADFAGRAPLALEKSSLADCRGLRERFLAGFGLYNSWDEAALRYNDREAAFLGGGVWRFEGGYALCYPDKDHVLVKELIGEPPLKPLAAALAKVYGAGEITFRRPGLGETPLGMSRWYIDRPPRRRGALSLVLD